MAGAGGGVADVADGVLAAEVLEDLLVEHLADQAEILVTVTWPSATAMPALSWPRC